MFADDTQRHPIDRQPAASRVEVRREVLNKVADAMLDAPFSGVRFAVAFAITAAFALFACFPSLAQSSDSAAPSNSAQPQAPILRAGPSLDAAFNHMYRLHFDAARTEVKAYEGLHPEDPMALTTESASYLFEEFSAKGVFTSAFFLDDKKLLVGVEGSVEANRNPKFLETNHRARDLANAHLRENSRDTRALLSLAMADGMESDYDALIEKKQLASLQMMKQADAEATRVLALDANAKDAYVSLGVANYIIGCLPAYKRAFLWFGNVHGDRLRGIDLMQNAATGGHYLQPFAKVMLALAYEREHHFDLAADLLDDLTRAFPENPHFAEELAIAQRNAPRK
jgi:hypothetical protein